MVKKRNIGFLMDPLESINPKKDTTLVLMAEATARGHDVIFLGPQSIWAESSSVLGRGKHVRVTRQTPCFEEVGSWQGALTQLDVLFIRTDPPFDDSYLYTTQLLDLVGDETFILNRPQGIRDCNEKLAILHFPELTAKTWVVQTCDELKRFQKSQSENLVIKPLHLFGGEGIEFVTSKTDDVDSAFQRASSNGTRPVMVQAFLEDVTKGDKRILVVNGEPIGAVLRVPQANSLKANFHSGGSAKQAEVTRADKKICSALRPFLLENGLYFVGLDVIGDMLTEINVTSPTGAQEIEALSGISVQKACFDFIEQRFR